MPRGKRGFGSIRRLPSKRWQVRYTGPDGRHYSARTNDGSKPLTFQTRRDAEAWLSLRHSEMLHATWKPPTEPAKANITLREYAPAWLADRELAVRTRSLYAGLLEGHIYPTFGDYPLVGIDSASVRTWHRGLALRTGKTRRAHAYSLLHAILRTAVDDELIAANPCKVRSGGQAKRQRPETEIATVEEIVTIAAAAPPRYQLLVLLAAWCTPRFGEVSELRRGDVDVRKNLLRIRRAVTYTKETGRIVKPPKSEAGIRNVTIPPHLMPLVEAHLRDHVGADEDALLFGGNAVGGWLPESTWRDLWAKARLAAGRSDLKFHDLRHTSGTLAAQTGASLKELMVRMGHSTWAAALRYQHSATGRDQIIAAGLSEIAHAGSPDNVTLITEGGKKKKPAIRKKKTA